MKVLIAAALFTGLLACAVAPVAVAWRLTSSAIMTIPCIMSVSHFGISVIAILIVRGSQIYIVDSESNRDVRWETA